MRALYENDRKAVAALIEYPIEPWIGDEAVIVENEKQFIKLYDKILPPGFRREILALGPRDYMSNCKGVALLDGRVWLDTKVFCLMPDLKAMYKGVSRTVLADGDQRKIIYTASGEAFEKAVRDLESVLQIDSHSDGRFFLTDDKYGDQYAGYNYVTVADVNNDGRKDYVVTWYSTGSGGFSNIQGIWSRIGGKLVRLPLEREFYRQVVKKDPNAEGEVEWCDVFMYVPRLFLVENAGVTYICLDRWYCWRSGRILPAVPEEGRLLGPMKYQE